ncbi:MAG: hypothetical protein ABI520_07930 [Caldimonas sp.]
MSAPLHCLRAVAAAALVAASGADALAGTQLFKCIDGGRTVYQQQACSVSSQPDGAASAPRIAAKASAPLGDAVSAAPRKLRSPASPASGVPATPR